MSHAKILTELQEMLASQHYKARWGTLAAAEQVIAEQERRIAELERNAAQGEPILWLRKGAKTAMHNIRFDQPDAGPWDALYAAPPDADKVERLAQSWDGCMYDAPGGSIDIGASIRAALKLTAPPAADKVRDQALEEAARRCEETEVVMMRRGEWESEQGTATLFKAAKAIRALKSAAPSTAVPEDAVSAAMAEGNKFGVKSFVAARIVAAYLAAPAQQAQPAGYADCCDTPAYCSSVRRCTAKDDTPTQAPRFPNVSCSQCGQDFGPGDSGYSSCSGHKQG